MLSPTESEAFKAAYADLYARTPRKIRTVMYRVMKSASDSAARAFYLHLLENDEARFFLSHDVVNERLHDALIRWLREVAPVNLEDVDAVIERQAKVGGAHARIGVPIWLVVLGMARIKAIIVSEILTTTITDAEKVDAFAYVMAILDFSVGIMTLVYVKHFGRAIRSDEVLRQFSLSQNLAADRERQRAALSDWAQSFFFQATLGSGEGHATLSSSEFGLWFRHRAPMLFGDTTEMDAIQANLTEVDDLVEQAGHAPLPLAILQRVKAIIGQMSAHIASLFDKALREASIHDPSTQLLSHRFLPALLSREIRAKRHGGRAFCVVVFALANADHLRSVHGDSGMRVILRQTAMQLYTAARSGDMVFALSQDRFLVVRVEEKRSEAQAFAETVAARHTAHFFDLNGALITDLRLAFGVAEFDGHPDPREIVNRAMQDLAASL